VAEVERRDSEVTHWLTKCWQLKKLGVDFVENELVTIGRITERVLFVTLLDGLADLPSDTKAMVKSKWQREFDCWVDKKRDLPSLWWWEETLFCLCRSATTNEHKVLTAMRARMAGSTWQSDLERVQLRSIINRLHELIRLRNAAAHGGSSSFTPEEVEHVRTLVYQRSRPGILLSALGFTTAQIGGKPRPL
jgi:hypothetical protein